MHKWITQKPSVTGAAAVYPYSPHLKELFTVESKFKDSTDVKLYKLIGSENEPHILLPRRLCPMGRDTRTRGIPASFISSFKPRNKEQTRVVAEATYLLGSDESFIIESPTGSGKTAMAMQLIANVNRKTLVVVTKEDVKDQWVAAAKQFLGMAADKIGFIQGDTCDVEGKDLVIGLIQSLAKEDRYPNSVWQGFGMVIWDECHRVGADKFSNSAWLCPALLRLGLSATPDRKDGKDIVLQAHIGPTMVRSETLPMIPKVLVYFSDFKLPLVTRKINGEFKRVKLPHKPGRTANVNNLLAVDKKRNKAIAKFTYQAYRKGRNIIIFSETRAHLKQLFSRCRKCGVKEEDIAFYIGGLSKGQRDEAKKKRVLLATYRYTSEATDIPWLDTMVMATPRSDVIQIVGRVIRQYPDKKQPLVFDVVDADSYIFTKYYDKRVRWYESVGAEVKVVTGK